MERKSHIMMKQDPLKMMGHAVAFGITFLATKGALEFDHVSEALAFYGVTHSHPGNQLVHFIFVPFLVWTFLLGLAHLPISSMVIKIPGAPKHKVTYATYWFVFLPTFYITLDQFGGLLYFMALYPLYTSAVRLHASDQKQREMTVSKTFVPEWLGTGSILRWAPLLHAFGWWAQIAIGHMHLEGNKPAATQSFGKSIIVSPLFAFYEGLWFLGINSDLQLKTMNQVALLTNELCMDGSHMRVCESMA